MKFPRSCEPFLSNWLDVALIEDKNLLPGDMVHVDVDDNWLTHMSVFIGNAMEVEWFGALVCNEHTAKSVTLRWVELSVETLFNTIWD